MNACYLCFSKCLKRVFIFLFNFVQTFHTPSLGDEEFEIPSISLDSDPSLAVTDVVGHFDDLGDATTVQEEAFAAQYGVQTLDMPVEMSHEVIEQSGGLLGAGLTMVNIQSCNMLVTLQNKNRVFDSFLFICRIWIIPLLPHTVLTRLLP